MTLPETVPAPTPQRRSRGWAVVGVVGELMVTVGVLLLLFVVYQLWWTNVVADRAGDQIAQQLTEQWQAEPTPAPDEEDPVQTKPIPGNAFALMYIPRLRDSVWGVPVLEGTDMASLAQGLGHYEGTAMPGEVGNFAVAGHRATNGEPFKDFDRLQAGDEVIVETRTGWFEYRLDKDMIVAPTATWTVLPVPGHPEQEPTEKLVTLTTCNPRWASTQRWIWWGTLTDEIDKSTGKVPDAIQQEG